MHQFFEVALFGIGSEFVMFNALWRHELYQVLNQRGGLVFLINVINQSKFPLELLCLLDKASGHLRVRDIECSYVQLLTLKNASFINPS